MDERTKARIQQELNKRTSGIQEILKNPASATMQKIGYMDSNIQLNILELLIQLKYILLETKNATDLQAKIITKEEYNKRMKGV